MPNCLTLLRPVHLNLTLLKYLKSNLLGQFIYYLFPGWEMDFSSVNHKQNVTALVCRSGLEEASQETTL